MSKLVFFPSDPISDYIKKGRTTEYLDQYYNPGGIFDEVFCLSPWGENEYEEKGHIKYIKANPLKFAKIISKINPDVIRGYGGYCCADWVSISKVKHIPTVVSVHDTNPELIHDSLRYADYIFCMSTAVKRAVVNKLNISEDKIYILPNRVDINLFKKMNDDGIFERFNSKYGKGKHILHVGRRSYQKNIDTVIRSLQYIDEDVSCIFVGQGDNKQYQELAETLKVADKCYFIDRIETNDLPYWYSWCDCFCVPSRWEGFGMVFIEAASCEAAVVTSNIGPMNEFLKNGQNAILVDEYENPHKIAEAISLVLQNSQDIQNMRKNARNVGLMFEKNKIDQMEKNLYSMIIPNKGRGEKNTKLYLKMLYKLSQQYATYIMSQLKREVLRKNRG